MNTKFAFYLLIAAVSFSCQNKDSKSSENIPTIQLVPEQSDTLKVSDYFNHVRILWLKDCLYNNISDYIELEDGYLTKVSGSYEFLLFNKDGTSPRQVGAIGRGAGEYLSALNKLQLSKDTTLQIINRDKFLEYTLDGRVVHEKKVAYKKSSHTTLPVFLLNDSLIVLYTIPQPVISKELKQDVQKQYESSSILQLYSLPSEQIIQSFFPMKETSDLRLYNQLYAYKDSLFFYSDKDGFIYQIGPEGKKVKYRIDKGKYSQHQTMEEFTESLLNRISDFRRIDIQSINETDRYILGKYLFKNHFYTFIYDKQNGKTQNFRHINNDLLGKDTPNILFEWMKGLQFKEDGLWLTAGRNFPALMDQIKSDMTAKEWNDFEYQHPDFIDIYKELKAMGKALEEETPIILIKYYFK